MRLFRFEGLSRVAGLTHGFASRSGGVSAGPFESLNLSLGVGDDPGAVRENRRRFCEALGVRSESVFAARQIHGESIACVNDAKRREQVGQGWLEGAHVGTADALLTDREGAVLVASAADCVLAAIVDPRRRIVGIAHCGWRGTFARLAEGLVREAVTRFRISPADLLAVLSPSIGPCCFEVGDEVMEEGLGSVRGFQRFARRGPRRWHVDLWEMNRSQLLSAGVRDDAIEISGQCTRCRSADFFSYRAGSGKTGIAALAIGFPRRLEERDDDRVMRAPVGVGTARPRSSPTRLTCVPSRS